MQIQKFSFELRSENVRMQSEKDGCLVTDFAYCVSLIEGIYYLVNVYCQRI